MNGSLVSRQEKFMPGPDGKLSDAEIATAHATLQQFWARVGGRKPCIQCGSPQYFIMAYLNANRSDSLSPMHPHKRLPTVAVSCQQCGYLEHFIAKNVGVHWLEVPTEGASNG